MDAGLAADRAGEYQHSRDFYRKAVAVSEGFKLTDPRRAYSWNALAKTQDVLGNYADAETGYRKALRLSEESSGKTSAVYALVLENLAILYTETAQYSRGERTAREALAAVEQSPHDELWLAMAQSCLATNLDLAGKHQEALRMARAALPALESHPEAWTQTTGVLNTIGVALYNAGDYAESERSFSQALSVAEQNGAIDHPLLTRVLANLATLALRDGRRAQAGALLERALGIAKAHLGVQHPMYGVLLAGYARYLRETGDKSAAKTLEARSSEILRENGRRNGIGALIDITALQKK